jgi:hypothetical protein
MPLYAFVFPQNQVRHANEQQQLYLRQQPRRSLHGAFRMSQFVHAEQVMPLPALGDSISEGTDCIRSFHLQDSYSINKQAFFAAVLLHQL